MGSNSWQNFAKLAAQNMISARENHISLEMVSDFFESAVEIRSDELRQFLVNTVWEIDGDPSGYGEITKMFESSADEEEFLTYMNT